MATIDLGRLGFVNKGTYNNSTTYEKNDLVQFTDGGILSTYLYIDSTAQSGQAPSSSGTAGSRWVFFAKGVADAVASAGNNKVLVTNASGNLTPLAIGSAGQVLKTNSGANGYEFGTISGGVLAVKFNSYTGTANATIGDGSWQELGAANSNFSVYRIDITPKSTSSRFIIEATAAIECLTYGNIAVGRQINGTGGVANLTGSSKHLIGNGTGDAYHNLKVTGRDYPQTTSPVNYRIYARGHGGSTIKINNAGNWNSSRNGITLRVTEYSSDVADWTFQGTGDTL